MRYLQPLAFSIAFLLLVGTLHAQDARASGDMYWGEEVPDGWNGSWPEELLTVPERTGFTRTMGVRDVHEFIDALKWRSEHMHVINVFRSPLGRFSSAVVLSNPRVTNPQQAAASGKPVVFLHGNIHPPESEGAEALKMVMREILLGDRQYLLDNQIIIIMPVLNVDGTESVSTSNSAPYISGTRTNSEGLDLNRDAIKLESSEVRGLYQNIFNQWDPVLYYDAHRMGRGNYAYAIAYVNSTVPAAHPGPRGYVRDELFPAVTERMRSEWGLEPFTHALWQGNEWPPRTWHHDATIWTVEAKFLANAYGLRNRMSILTETPSAAGYERQIYAQYAYILSLLDYTNEHGQEMLRVVREADEETVSNVLAQAESGELRNYLDGEYRSRGEIDLLAYRDGFPTVPTDYIPGTSVRERVRPSGPPEVVSGVQDITLPVGTREARVPRGYLIPAEMEFLVENLRIQNVEVTRLEAPVVAEGEQFTIDRMRHDFRGGYDMTELDGAFAPSVREFPAGSWYVDMAQPLANLAFYYLEPQSRDGYVGWRVLDDTLVELGVNERPTVYPIFKFRREVDGR